MSPEPSILPPPGRASSRRRVVFLLAAAGAAGALVALGLNYRPVASRVVTYLAFRSAETLAVELLALDERAQGEAWEPAVKSLVARYGRWFKRGFIDREAFLRRCPAEIDFAPLVPPLLVLHAYLEARYQHLQFVSRATVIEETVLAEAREWLDPAFLCSAPKELLANFFTQDLVLHASGKKIEGDGFLKLGSFLGFLAETDHPFVEARPDAETVRCRERLARAIATASWDAAVRDCDHPREKVRAGALLLLHSHPEPEMATGKLRRALGDPSEWVRLAAAGCLALRGDGAGEATLLAGLDHERWEVRFWSVYGLVRLGKPAYLAAVRRRHDVEADAWLQGVLREAVKVLAGPP